MNRIQAILTLDMENLPANFQEILKHEQEVVAKWKAEGFLESLWIITKSWGGIDLKFRFLSKK
jgi:muconolactone D-isomerase